MDAITDAGNQLKRDLFIEVLSSFGEARLAVKGTSMLPAVRPGDILNVRREFTENIVPGDIVLFARGDRLSAHRVVRTIENHQGSILVTRGDRLLRADPPVFNDELLGRVSAIKRGNRRIGVHLTRWCRIAAWILCRSEFGTQLLLRLDALRQKSPARDPVWSN